VPYYGGCGWFWAWTIAVAVAVVLAGLVAAFTVSLDALVTPLVTLALGLWPALPRTAAGLARIVLIAGVIPPARSPS
jgi:amino acid permease